MEDIEMFESLSYLALQQYWWAIVSLLGAVLGISAVCAGRTNPDLYPWPQ